VKKEIATMTEAIIRAHGGKAYFNMTEARKIVGCGENTIATFLHSKGITVQRVGPSKRISAYDLALAMSTGRVAPIE
jgi:hypothetical protein